MLVISQSKPMALPVRDTKGENYEGYQIVDSLMTPETAGTELKKYPGMSYIGSGSYGPVYDSGGLSNTVVKYIYDKDEASTYNWAIKGIPGLVKVFKVEQLQDDVWTVIMAKVKTLKLDEKRLTEHLRMLRSTKNIDWYDYVDSDQILKILVDSGYELTTHLRYFVIKYVELRTKHVKVGIINCDMSGNNIGWDDNGDLVLFDLGLLST